ncbi:MAG: hypothetical protein K2X47_09370 [Bdellovibrionales bacterium]|nr:hypothetical protein [Bdellovibrionales bacterium]
MMKSTFVFGLLLLMDFSLAGADQPAIRGPFSDISCENQTLASFKEYREGQMADAFQIVNALEAEEVIGLFDAKEEFIDHVLIQAPWILANKSVVFGVYMQCFTALHLFLQEPDQAQRGLLFQGWASCVERAFPEISPAVRVEMNCLESLAYR